MTRLEKFWLGVICVGVVVCGGCSDTQAPKEIPDTIIGWDSVIKRPSIPLP